VADSLVLKPLRQDFCSQQKVIKNASSSSCGGYPHTLEPQYRTSRTISK